jgi:hypothetical protein
MVTLSGGMLTGMRWMTWLLAGGLVAVLPVHGQVASGSIEIPAGARVLLQAQGKGFQIYRCTPGDAGWKWVLAGPDARLLDSHGKQIGTHFVGPTWKLNDGSAVQGELMASQPSPEAGSVAWLLLRAKAGSANGKFADVAYIRRTDTHGGSPDKEACRSETDAGKTARAPYTATYTFYAGK